MNFNSNSDFYLGRYHSHLTKLNLTDQIIYQVYALFRIGDFQSSRQKLDEIDKSTIKDSFLLELHDLVDCHIENSHLTIEITNEALKKLELELNLRLMFADGKYDDIIAQHDSIMKKTSVGDFHVNGYLLMILGDAYSFLRSDEQAKVCYEKAFEFSKNIGNEYLKIDYLIKFSVLERRKLNMDKASDLLHKALEQSKRIDYPSGKHLSQYSIGTNYFRQAEYHLANEYFNLSLEICREFSTPLNQARVLMMLAMVTINQADYKTATGYLEESQSVYEKHGTKYNKMDVKGLFAYIYNSEGKLDEAKSIFLELINYYRETGDIYSQADALISVSQVSQRLGEYSEAMNFLAQCEGIMDEQTSQLRGRIYTYFGDLHSLKAEFGQALTAYEKARMLFIEIQNPHEESLLLNRIAKAYFFQGNIDETEKALQIGIATIEEVGDDANLAGMYYLFVKTSIAKEDLSKAEQYDKYLKELGLRNDNIYIKLFYLLSSILIAINKRELIELAKAKQLIEDLIKGDIPDKELYVQVKIEYLDILLFEYETFALSDLHDTLISELNELIQFTRNEQLYLYYGELNLILSRIYILDKKFTAASDLLGQVLRLTLDKSLYKIAIVIANEMDSLIDLISVHSQLEKPGKSLPTKVRILLNRYADHNRGKIEGHGKLIILASKDWKAIYTSTLSEIKSSENLVQTILHGLSTLHSGSISDTGFTYQSISKLRTLIKKIDDFYLIYCYKGSSYIASEKIKSLGNLIEINGILLNFQGDSKNSHFIRKEIEIIISEFFDLPHASPSVLTDIFEETKSIKNLTKFKDLLHPFRLSIIQMLEKNYQLPRSVLQEILSINPGTLNSHLNKLLKMNYIGKKLEFIDEKPRDMYFIQSAGMYQLNSLKEVLQGTMI